MLPDRDANRPQGTMVLPLGAVKWHVRRELKPLLSGQIAADPWQRAGW
jgi:hypothetical protein